MPLSQNGDTIVFIEFYMLKTPSSVEVRTEHGELNNNNNNNNNANLQSETTLAISLSLHRRTALRNHVFNMPKAPL